MTGDKISNLQMPVSDAISAIMKNPMVIWTLMKSDSSNPYFNKMSCNFDRMAIDDEFINELKEKILSDDALDQHTYIIDAFLKEKHNTFGIAYDGVALGIEDKTLDEGGYLKLSSISKTATATLFSHFVLHKFDLLRGSYPRLQPLGIWFHYDDKTKTFEARLFLAYFPNSLCLITEEIRNASTNLLESKNSDKKTASDMIKYTPMLISLAWAWRIISEICDMDAVLRELGNPSGILNVKSSSPDDLVRAKQHSHVSAHVQGNPSSYGHESEKTTWNVLEKVLTPIKPYQPFASLAPPSANGWVFATPIPTPPLTPSISSIKKDRILYSPNPKRIRPLLSDEEILMTTFKEVVNMISPDSNDPIKKMEHDKKKENVMNRLIQCIIDIEETLQRRNISNIWDPATSVFGRFCNNSTQSHFLTLIFGKTDLFGIVPREISSKQDALLYFEVMSNLHISPEHPKYELIKQFGAKCNARIAEFLMKDINDQKRIFNSKCFHNTTYNQYIVILEKKVIPLHYKINKNNLLRKYVDALETIEKLSISLALSNSDDDDAAIVTNIKLFTKEKFKPIAQQTNTNFLEVDSILESLAEINGQDKRIPQLNEFLIKYKTIKTHTDLAQISKDIELYEDELDNYARGVEFSKTFYNSMGIMVALFLIGVSHDDYSGKVKTKIACNKILSYIDKVVLMSESTDPIRFKNLYEFDGLINAYNYLNQFSRCILSNEDNKMTYSSEIFDEENNNVFNNMVRAFYDRLLIAKDILKKNYASSSLDIACTQVKFLIENRDPKIIAIFAANLKKNKLKDDAALVSTKICDEFGEEGPNNNNNDMYKYGSSSYSPAPSRPLASLSYKNDSSSKKSDDNDGFTVVAAKKNPFL
jgi:hypothetical protein